MLISWIVAVVLVLGPKCAFAQLPPPKQKPDEIKPVPRSRPDEGSL